MDFRLRQQQENKCKQAADGRADNWMPRYMKEHMYGRRVHQCTGYRPPHHRKTFFRKQPVR